MQQIINIKHMHIVVMNFLTSNLLALGNGILGGVFIWITSLQTYISAFIKLPLTLREVRYLVLILLPHFSLYCLLYLCLSQAACNIQTKPNKKQ